jgi:hypothetical protein
MQITLEVSGIHHSETSYKLVDIFLWNLEEHYPGW